MFVRLYAESKIRLCLQKCFFRLFKIKECVENKAYLSCEEKTRSFKIKKILTCISVMHISKGKNVINIKLIVKKLVSKLIKSQAY